MKSYQHLSLEEREKLYAFKQAGLSLREIGKKLKRPESSLSRELKRNAKYGMVYIPCRTQSLADKRGFGQRHKAPLKDPLIFLYVREHLREDGWTPEEIAARLSIDHPGYSVSHETIYRYIYSKKMMQYQYRQYLTLGRKKRMRRNGRSVKRDGRIPGSMSIDLRPKEIDKRTTVGHWETDNMAGKKSDTSTTSATVERLTRLTLFGKLPDRSAGSKTKTVVDQLLGFPEELRQTLTADNGKENSYHQKITDSTGLKVFFCHAYHSWEKGTVENTIGRIRRYIPKGTSIDSLTDRQIDEIEYRLNSTPRKCLGYLTPYEKMAEVLSKGTDALPV